jgi:hypothetical protein
MDDLESQLKVLGIHPLAGDNYFPASEGELTQLESAVGGRLPDDYRWFLGRYGHSLFKAPLSYPSSQAHGGYLLGFFYGSNDAGEGVLTNYNFYEGQFPKGIVPIGEDGLGDLYLLAATGPNRGKVYYWDHGVGWEGEAEEYRSRGQEVPESLKYRCLEEVAPTFTAFVFGLQPDED